MSLPPAVRLNGVTKRFAGVAAVDSLDMTVPKGTIFGLIGPNGSGKTTTMRMILRIYRPDEGQVEVLGNTDRMRADPRVGYLPEERGLYRRMTVEKVLRYFARLKHVRDPGSAVDDQLRRLGAIEWKKKRIEQLSKGMAQKIQFIVAVLARPELVILDEPFSGLDPVAMNLLRDEVLQLRESGTTVIFSTHDMSVAQNLCDHVFMIYRGRKVLDGSIDSIRHDHAEVRVLVRLIGNRPLPSDLGGVIARSAADGGGEILTLESEAARGAVLKQLTESGDVDHFERLRPSLHDIFVQIAKPDPSEQGPGPGDRSATASFAETS